MNKKSTAIIIGIIIILTALFVALGGKKTAPAPAAPNTADTNTPTEATYTMAQVAVHNMQADCWTSINGSVYNVTSWISQHPGGAKAIIGLCGKDGSGAFNGQHGGQPRPVSELAGFKIGTLAN